MSIGSEVFGAYRTLSVLGRGGMGTVYAAEHVDQGTRVALKVINGSLASDATANERFLREARVVAKLAHPNIVRFLDMGEASGRPFIVMELLEGETLDAFVQREARLKLAQVLEIFLPLTSAVFAIHGAGVVHRDLKLTNIFLAQRASGRIEPVVLDFGISRVEDASLEEASLTRSAGILGTPRYLSPEQVRNVKHASALSDQYAIGVMLYESVTGQRPFSGTSPYELMHAILTLKVAPPRAHAPDLPAAFDAIVARAMHRDANARFPDVRALGSALLTLAEGSSWSNFAREFLDLDRPDEDDLTEADCRPVESIRVGGPSVFSHAIDAPFAEPIQAPRLERRTRQALAAVCVILVGVVSSALVLGENRSVAKPAARSPVEASVVRPGNRLGPSSTPPDKFEALVLASETPETMPPAAPAQARDVTPTRAPRSSRAARAATQVTTPGASSRRPVASAAPARAKDTPPSPTIQTVTVVTEAQTHSRSELGEDDAIDPFSSVSR